MFFQFFKLQLLKAVRSASLGRKLIGGIILGIFGIIMLLNVLALGIGLKTIILKATGRTDVTQVINSWVIYFFLLEMIYRFFLQKNSAIELNHYLHLPVSRAKIIHYLLLRSFLSAFNIVVLLLFVPVYWMEVSGTYGPGPGLFWLSTIIVISWAIHWLMMLFKQEYGDRIAGILGVFCIFLAGISSAWYGWFSLGSWTAPFFNATLHGPWPFVIALAFCGSTYVAAYQYYRRHAYLEELGPGRQGHVFGDNIAFFDRFGLAGAVADLELKLVLRHKKSRPSLIISVLFLAYGLIFYTNGSYTFSGGVPTMAIFIGIFITGVFIMNYGRLFLSWNSPHFDFFLSRRDGIEALVQGKYLLFIGISLAAYILTIPYVYFGWNILLVHTAAFIFNIGVNMHIIIYMALWKPKPMDLRQGAMFNYEGMGAAQFLMAIPMILLPYAIYWPVSYFVNDMAGLMALGSAGILGIIFHQKFIDFHVKQILHNKYSISSSFRGEV
ncbi:MAG TPA: DUF5687 family protein [Balneolaceae bacterium]|nr:DUF5687 family protein [Balneolaceae bacterium]